MKLSGTRKIAAALGLAALTAAGPASAATTWLMASGYPEDNFHTKNIRMFIEEVEEKSGGELTIDLQPNDSLIKLDSIKRAIQSGQIPIGELRLGVYGNEDPMYILAGLPFVAPTYATAWDLKDAQKPYFDKLFGDAGMKVLYYTPWPGQGFYTKFPIEEASDLEGVKLRIYSTSTQEMGELLGFQATILPFAEIPQAFSTGLIEALFTSPQTGIDIQAWDNTDHFTDAGAIYTKNAVVVSSAAFDALDEATQKVVLDAAVAAEKRGWEMSEATNKEQQGILADNGMTVSQAPDWLIEKMKTIGGKMLVTWKESASPEAIEAVTPYFQAQGLE
ncbi:TRAP transporter substrate-binding protein [Acuticoccus sp. I52.16.1]|uniref:TRAP transporter substrate-binding protein n=1 Tax=Acuticoccus sp. I52.16.1 TaxID=2928472 RepID=UPI001FD1AB6E|nr:TRAP transporter substrate-binding protein [Acuticoccus sp. I52.16.1]UOM36482.1 TRAP transporter substrate-binding protein [Acuticoccus sp. I52.16.1]